MIYHPLCLGHSHSRLLLLEIYLKSSVAFWPCWRRILEQECLQSAKWYSLVGLRPFSRLWSRHISCSSLLGNLFSFDVFLYGTGSCGRPKIWRSVDVASRTSQVRPNSHRCRDHRARSRTSRSPASRRRSEVEPSLAYLWCSGRRLTF